MDTTMSRRSRNGNGHHQVSREIAEIEGLLRDLNSHLVRLSKASGREAAGAGGNISDAVLSAVTEILSDTVQRLRNGTHEMADDMADRFRDGTRAFADEAATLGSTALRKITEEVENRPMRTLAVAAGIGY